jgi:hypothetical protein
MPRLQVPVWLLQSGETIDAQWELRVDPQELLSARTRGTVSVQALEGCTHNDFIGKPFVSEIAIEIEKCLAR